MSGGRGAISHTVVAMASSNRPSKDKRARHNRAQREARAARSARAGEATAIGRGEQEPVTRATPAAASSTASSGGKGDRARPVRTPRYTIPGQRAVVMAFLFTLVSAGTLLFAPIRVEREVALDDPRVEEDSDRTEDGERAIILEDAKLVDEESALVAGTVLLAPIAIAGGAVYFTKRKQRTAVWTMALVGMAGVVFFSGPYGVISLPAMIALAVGGFQSRRADNKPRIDAIKAERAARKAARDGEDAADADPTDTARDEADDADGASAGSDEGGASGGDDD